LHIDAAFGKDLALLDRCGPAPGWNAAAAMRWQPSSISLAVMARSPRASRRPRRRLPRT